MTTTKHIYKGKILFLHGYTQSSSLFYGKTSALRKRFIKLGYKPIYIQAPIKLTPNDIPGGLDAYDDNNRAWWVKPGLSNNGVSMQASIDTIKDYIDNNKLIEDEDLIQQETEDEKNLPIVGLVGFSQGACLAGLIANKFSLIFQTQPLKFVVLYSGFKLDTSKQSGNSEYDHYYQGNPSGVKYLHVYGELDTIIDETRSLSLYNITKQDSEILKHPGGHFVPNSKVLVDKVLNWVQNVENTSQSTSVASSDEQSGSTPDDLDDILNMMDNIGKA